MFCTVYRAFHKMLHLLSRFVELAICLLFAGMILLAGLQIVLRIFFHSGIVWAEPLLRYLVLWVGMLGAVAATERNKHITIDLASNLFQAELKPWLGVVMHVFSFLVCLVLACAAVVFVINESNFGGAVVPGISSWVMNLIFPVAFTMISFRFLSAAVDDIMAIARKSCPYF